MFNTAILFFENASMGIITQGIEKITCRWDSTLNMVKYNHNMRSEVYSMKKLFKVFSLMLVVIMAFPFSVMASENDQQRSDLIGAEERDFEKLIAEIQNIKATHPDYSEEMLMSFLEANHQDVERGIIDIWNALTDSEKKLCIRYPFDALKVNKAKNIATSQTEAKFGTNGLGNRSDAFRHGIWNAEMTVLIGKERAELFATAHEDKDVTGTESDGYPKTAHRDMDLHNNEVGREIGEKNKEASESEMADIIYQEIYSATTSFIWLEMLICLFVCMSIAIYLHTIPEFLVSTGVFMFLRTYAGGVHLNSFKACFICSVTVQVMILQINNKYPLELFVAWGIILVSSICIWKLSPVENINHELKKEEKEHCRKVTGKILGAIFIAAGCCTALGMKKYLSLIALTALTVFISQCIGIIKYKVEKEKN